MTRSDSDSSDEPARFGGPQSVVTAGSARTTSALWRTALFPVLIVASVAVGNWLLVASFGTTRDLGSAAAAAVIVPGANVLAACLAFALVPVARWTVRPRSLKPHVAAAISGPVLAAIADIIYIRNLPLGH